MIYWEVKRLGKMLIKQTRDVRNALMIEHIINKYKLEVQMNLQLFFLNVVIQTVSINGLKIDNIYVNLSKLKS